VEHQRITLVDPRQIKFVGPCLDTGNDLGHEILEALCVRVLLEHKRLVRVLWVLGLAQAVIFSASLGDFLANAARVTPTA
jgi:hypothetical protein